MTAASGSSRAAQPVQCTALIVEDHFLISEHLRLILESFGYRVCGEATSAAEAVRLALLHRPDVILMDVRLDGDGDGVDAAMAIIPHLDARIIYVTASSEEATMTRIRTDTPWCVLGKPIDPASLAAALTSASPIA